MQRRQIAVRLPADVVEYIDEVVARGASRSRAAVVTSALRREQRRATAESGVQILAAGHDDPDDLDALAACALRTPLDDL